MNNGNKPIHSFTGTKYCAANLDGLTKREHASISLLSGLLANPNVGQALRTTNPQNMGEADSQLAITAIRLADELLEQLETKSATEL